MVWAASTTPTSSIQRQGLYAYVRTARFVRVPALMSLLGPEKHDCPEFISLKSPRYIYFE